MLYVAIYYGIALVSFFIFGLLNERGHGIFFLALAMFWPVTLPLTAMARLYRYLN